MNGPEKRTDAPAARPQPPRALVATLRELSRESDPMDPAGKVHNAKPVPPRANAKGSRPAPKAGPNRPGSGRGLVTLDGRVRPSDRAVLRRAIDQYGVGPGILIKNLGLGYWRIDPGKLKDVDDCIPARSTHVRWSCTRGELRRLSRLAQTAGARSIAGFCIGRAMDHLSSRVRPGSALPLLLTREERRMLVRLHWAIRHLAIYTWPHRAVCDEVAGLLSVASHQLATHGAKAPLERQFETALSLMGELLALYRYGADMEVVSEQLRNAARELASALEPGGV